MQVESVNHLMGISARQSINGLNIFSQAVSDGDGLRDLVDYSYEDDQASILGDPVDNLEVDVGTEDGNALVVPGRPQEISRPQSVVQVGVGGGGSLGGGLGNAGLGSTFGGGGGGLGGGGGGLGGVSLGGSSSSSSVGPNRQQGNTHTLAP